jgi:nicotinamidase-related amidase
MQERVMGKEARTLRDLEGLSQAPAALRDAALVLIDCQNTYRSGSLELDGAEPALNEAAAVLERARACARPVIHIQQDGVPGSLFDVRAPIGAIADVVAPRADEILIRKQYPNAFIDTRLHEVLQELEVQDLVLLGFMTHMCVSSTARGAFNLGYRPTVVARATATRAVPSASGTVVPAPVMQEASLAALRDLFAVVVEAGTDLR